jgi:cytochrome c6
MRRPGIFVILICFIFVVSLAACEKPKEQAGTTGTAGTAEQAKQGEAQSGEALFKQHCAVCHPDGGNNVNPQKTLHKKDREANGVKTAADIIGKMRNPGPGMTKFDETTLPDKDAQAIAEYELKTF